MMLALLFSFSLSRIRLRYVLTVFGLTPSSAAICLNATPEPNIHSTWYSRGESASCPGLLDDFVPGRRFAHHRHVGAFCHDALEPFADDQAVVCEEQRDRGGRGGERRSGRHRESP